MSQEYVNYAGIDLGTTNSAIACVDRYGKPEIIANAEGERTTPSTVAIEPDGIPLVGIEAVNQALIEPERTIRHIKREMGNPSYRKNIDGEEYSPETISAFILQKLVKDAKDRLEQVLKQVVISVPAYFKDTQREATRQAAEIAGLEVIRIINEPTAAAIAYGLDKEENQTILVYDWGGGTFDVTIMQIEDKEFTVLATDGDARLGGADVDAKLIDFLAEDFLDVHGIDLRDEPHTLQDLRDKAEIAKKDLSFRNSTIVTLSQGEKTARVNIDRDDFNDLIKDLIAKTESCLNRVIKDAGLSWSDIDKVLLVGGSTRIPLVKETIIRVTGAEPVTDINPDECVAMGAAIQAVIAMQETDKDSETESPLVLDEAAGCLDIQVNDINTHSLGVKAFSPARDRYVNSIIIPRLTPIPCEHTKVYRTSEDNQKRVEFDVLQGEDENPRSMDVDRIGKAGLRDLPPHKAGELFLEVTLRYTADGIVEVITKEQQSGKVSREVVMPKTGTLSSEIIKAQQDKLAKMA